MVRVDAFIVVRLCVGTFRQMCIFNKLSHRGSVGHGNSEVLNAHRFGCNKLNRIFITHMHGDHLFGLSSVILGIGFEHNPEELRNSSLSIYGPLVSRSISARAFERALANCRTRSTYTSCAGGISDAGVRVSVRLDA